MVVTSLSYAFSLSLKVICFSFLIYLFGELNHILDIWNAEIKDMTFIPVVNSLSSHY